MNFRYFPLSALVALAIVGVASVSATERDTGVYTVDAATLLSKDARTYDQPRMTMHAPIHTIVRTENWEIQSTSLTGYRIRTAYNLQRSGSLLHINFLRPSPGVTLVEVTAVATARDHDPAADIRRFFEQLDQLTGSDS
jgi:hypothetical protein